MMAGTFQAGAENSVENRSLTGLDATKSVRHEARKPVGAVRFPPRGRRALAYRMIRRVLLLLIALPVAGIAGAVHPELSGRVAAPAPAGCAEYGFLFIRLYRAELWTDAETLPGENFGLTLTYRRDFSRDLLVSSSISEMARMSGRPEGSFGPARAQLEMAMRRVSQGDRFTAWRNGAGGVEFFFNGKGVGILDRDADLFLDIWLGDRSREAGKREKLLSGRCESRYRSDG